jgi:hypothetical protein
MRKLRRRRKKRKKLKPPKMLRGSLLAEDHLLRGDPM